MIIICPHCKKKIINHNLNDNQEKILRLLKGKEYTITEIKDKLTISYKSTWKHIRILERIGYIKTKKIYSKSGQPVMVKLIHKG